MGSLCLALVLLVPLRSAAQAERRVALVIGNSAYQHTRVLPNARNDARAIAGLLRKIGFEVSEVHDLGYRPMRDAIRAFGRLAAGAEMAVVYYAGHGLEVAGENYLVPTDARLGSDADLEYEAVTLASLLDAVRARRKLGLVILDACRNNPLADKMSLRAGTSRSVSRGLARIEPVGDVLVAYAAKAGTLAQDGIGENSPYATALLQHLPTPGLDIVRMFGRVKEAVLKATAEGQEPWIYGSPGGEIIALVPGAIERAPEHDADDLEWIKASAANRLEAYRTYIQAYPNGKRLTEAQERAAQLERLATQWAELGTSKDLARLREFADLARNTEFGPVAEMRARDMAALESLAWNDALSKQRLVTYQAFISTWPRGEFAVAARVRLEELETIRSEWLRLRATEDESALEAFIFRYGWSEYGLEATSQLIALRKSGSKPDSPGIRTVAADEMLRLIDNASITFQESGEIMHFSTRSVPSWRSNIGKDLLKRLLKEDLAAEGAFVSKGTRDIQGIGGVVRSKVDKTGSLFLLQMHGTERTIKDVDRGDRQFKTLQVIADSFGYVCIATDWHSILASTKPKKVPERCSIAERP